MEVFNDINRELVTLYRVVQNHLEEFVRYFKWTLVSRDEFTRQMQSPSETLTDIQRAVRFYYLQKCAFGGKVRDRSFGYSLTNGPRLNLLRIEEELSSVHLRLARVVVECLPYDDILKRYDRPETLFYLDPPYNGSEDYYGKGVFSSEDYAVMADMLKNLKGRFILSINDTPFVRDIFNDFKMREVSVLYSLNGRTPKTFPELIISK